MTRRVAVRAIIVDDGKLLCVKLKPYRIKYSEEFWCTIGGGIDENEALIPALQREVFEETGVKPVVGKLLYIQQYANDVEEQLEFFFHITNVDDFKNIDVSKTSHGAEEIAEIGFVDPKTTVVLPEFLRTQDFSNLEKKPVQIFNYL